MCSCNYSGGSYNNCAELNLYIALGRGIIVEVRSLSKLKKLID